MTVATRTRPALHSRWQSAVAVGVAGLGTALPPRVVTNQDFAARLDTSDEWIRSRTGIERRHVSDDLDSTTTLALVAARAAVADAGVEGHDLAAVVVATCTPDTAVPATAPTVAAGLGSTALAFDVNAACAGFVTSLLAATSIVESTGRPVLVVGAESMTRVVDPDDRTTAVLFGDGAGAVVLAPSHEGALLGPFDTGSDGDLADLLIVPPGEAHLRMRGREVYRHAVARMVESSAALLERAGLDVGDVDLVVAHQANLRILDAVAARLGVPAERLHVTVDRHGNTSSASIPLALADARAQGRLQPGATVLLTAFGAGFTWASALLRWPDTRVPGDLHATTGETRDG